ncbi:MAG: SdrD B-like domain-containing protein [Anaerolineales bacterium]|nr:SdrD B-like domain-containing protein [Anaerolineales bacterium]
MRQGKLIFISGMRLLVLLAMVLGAMHLRSQPVRAETNTLTLRVVSARTEPDHPGGPVVQGQVISQYKFLINVDNTGDPTQPREDGCSPADVGYPDSCDWPSIRQVPGAAPIFTQGDESVLNETTGIPNLPDGKYLISVLADGYKIGGAHFTVPLPDPGLVIVELQPHPLPPAIMRIKVFEDISPTNGQFDAPAEHGLAGFTVIINDILGQVSTDVFGNPLCTQYDVDGNPLGQTNCLVSDANGDIVVPNLGPNRYDVNMTAPTGETWVQTTTLEGSHSWDTWLQEGGTGLDNEFVNAGEPFPWTVFGFVRPTDLLNDPQATGGVSGVVVSASVYVPWGGGGLPYYGGQWGGLSGAKLTGPVTDAWVALSDLQNGDTAVYVGPVDQNGAFNIQNVPDGNYLFTYWDYRQHYILDWMQVIVSDGQVTDLGTPFLTGWFTWVEGYVFEDTNSNGKRDPGERGIPDYLIVLKDRDNTEIDRMTIAVTTNHDGYYFFDRAYPMGSWMILEAYNDRYYTTGVTYQVENQPTETTVLGNGVDVGILPILGQTGRLDWGVRPYAPGTNGGIVGTVFYDTTRNELDARYQAVEGWAPGIPDMRVNVWEALKDQQGNFIIEPDGSYAKGKLLNSGLTETWEQPVDCQARDADGNPVNQSVLPPATGGYRCLEGPLMGVQFQTGFSTLDGNYGFGTIWTEGLDPQTFEPIDSPTNQEIAMPAGDYLVEVVIPEDDFGRPKYKVVKEEDINVFGGDEFVPQIPPPACAGPTHIVDVAGIPPDGPDAVENPSFADAGGSPFEGMPMPLCNVKLVTVSNGRSIAPTFNLFTDVPIPGKWKGYIIDDLALSTNPQDLMFGEKAGMPNAPIGVYDFTGKLFTTIQSDPNGVYEVLLPSTNTINCPTPSGVCPNVYYILGNDPGQPGNPNPNYNPQYRTIGTSFEVWPGVMLPSDLAPTQIGVTLLSPGSTFGQPPQCMVDATTPELFAVSQPYVTVNPNNGTGGSFTILGQGFGAQQGANGKVTLDGIVNLPVTAWSDTAIDVSVPATTTPGAWQLDITTDAGKKTINGLTFHVRGPGYRPDVYEVGPGRAYQTIQSAINAAAAQPTRNSLVVVYPGAPTQWNPFGVYYENVVIYSRMKLQGVGPGGVRRDNSIVLGSVIDGVGVLGDTEYAENWRVFVESLTWDGNQTVYEGPVIYILAEDGEFRPTYRNAIDGFTIQGGDQQGFPNFLPGAEPGAGGVVTVQGGGIFANAYARYLLITNNVLRSNGGAYGGAIRLGTPHLPGAENDNQNDGVRIAHNRVIANGGTNLAGAIGIFSGAEGYEVDHNDMCGNFSAEYGGGVSHYGYSPNGSIHDNRIYFNRSYDEGGGIIIAGELPADPTLLTPGSGPVNIYNNLIQANLANDDGGGIRFLMAGNYPMNVYNNIIVNNVSTHEGGGISLNDAPDVRVFNNTIMKNITTATAVTSNGLPAPAGLSTSRNSAVLQATLPPSAPIFSNPLLFNNIFWDNRAGSWTGGGVAGVGLQGDPSPINYWDLGVSDGVGLLSPTNSVLQTNFGVIPDASNQVGVDPMVVAQYDTSVAVLPWRGHPRFVDTLLVAVELPPEQMGDYHLTSASPAVDLGAAFKGSVPAPASDFEGEQRVSVSIDAGADEILSPVVGFPLTGVLDNFNRPDGSLGSNWAGLSSWFTIVNQQARANAAVWLRWNILTYGANQEAYFTLNNLIPGAEHGLMLKLNGSNPDATRASLIYVAYDPSGGNVLVQTKASTQGWVTHAVFPATLNPGDRFGARAQSDGTVNVYINGALVGSVNLLSGPIPWPNSYVTGGGKIGVRFAGTGISSTTPAIFDDFGGGTMP